MDLLDIQTNQVRVTMSGPALPFHIQTPSILKVLCKEPYKISLHGNSKAVSEQFLGNVCLREYQTAPLFHAKQPYTITIEALGKAPISFWHNKDEIHTRTAVPDRTGRTISGTIFFKKQGQFSELVILVDGTDHLHLVLEICPAKIYGANMSPILSNLFKKPSLHSRSRDNRFLARIDLAHSSEMRRPKVNWSEQDVLIGTLRNQQQLHICLSNRFYHIPASQLQGCDFPIRYVAIYQSKTLFGAAAGIQYYGKVTKCTPVLRSQITEIPARPGSENVLYYRFEIKKWKCLRKPILAKEIGFVRSFTNLFLLKHSTEVPELWLRSEAEYQLYTKLKQGSRSAALQGPNCRIRFQFGAFTTIFQSGQILIYGENRLLARYSISDFSKSPYAVFQQIQKTLAQVENERIDQPLPQQQRKNMHKSLPELQSDTTQMTHPQPPSGMSHK